MHSYTAPSLKLTHTLPPTSHPPPLSTHSPPREPQDLQNQHQPHLPSPFPTPKTPTLHPTQTPTQTPPSSHLESLNLISQRSMYFPASASSLRNADYLRVHRVFARFWRWGICCWWCLRGEGFEGLCWWGVEAILSTLKRMLCPVQ
jgi:hypothetical protein